MYNTGDLVDYKIRAGRGRPSAGTVIEKKGDVYLLETAKGKRIQVPEAAVRGKHVTRYTERQRRLL